MRKIALAFAMSGALAVAGCAGLSPTEERVLTGGAAGAAGGAALGGITGGDPLTGAVIGGAAGAGGGYLYDEYRRRQGQ